MSALDARAVDAQARARERVAFLAGLAESGIRAAALTEQLALLEPWDAAWLLELLVRGALEKEATSAFVYGALIDPTAIDEGLGAERLLTLRAAASEAGCIGALQWLGRPAEADDPELVRRDLLVDRDLRHLTLGHRRALARKARGDVLVKFLRDPDPVVVANLLGNPTTTEATVLAICSRRPTVSAPLEAVQRSARWNNRYRVRLALVRNPHLRERFAVTLLACLELADLLSIKQDETLGPSLRLSAQRLFELTSESGGG